jgi:hypothetical protein
MVGVNVGVGVGVGVSPNIGPVVVGVGVGSDVGSGVGVGVSPNIGPVVVGVGAGAHESGDSVGDENPAASGTTSMNAILVGATAPVEILRVDVDKVPDSLFEGVVQSRTLNL